MQAGRIVGQHPHRFPSDEMATDVIEASPWTHGPLFGSLNSFATVEAMEKRQRIMSHLYEAHVNIRVFGDGEADIVVQKGSIREKLRDDGPDSLEEARSWRLARRLEYIHEHTDEWRFVGCELCFL